MKETKWAFLKPFAEQLLAQAKADGKEVSLKEVAEVVKTFYGLELTVSQVYQILYRLIKVDSLQDNHAYLSTLAERVSTKQAGLVPEEKELPKYDYDFMEVEGLTSHPDPVGEEGTPGPVGLPYRYPNAGTAYTTPGQYVVIGCGHAPGHNQKLFDGVRKMIADNKQSIAGLIFIGDMIDCASLSDYAKGKLPVLPGLTLDDEYEAGGNLVRGLARELRPDAIKVYMYGNHEDRWSRYMSDAENSKKPLASPEAGMVLIGFDIYRKWAHDYITLGNHLDLMHGQYFNVHCAKKHIDNYRGSVMFAHTHRIQTYIEGSVGGFNIGWMGDENSPLFSYMPRGNKKQWQNGFAVVNIDEHGDYFVQQIIAHNNKFYFNGKRYS